MQPGAAQADQVGTVLAGRYRVLDRLGQGGMGIVYRVEDTASGDVVALKTLRLSGGPSERSLLLFKTEFWAMTRLRHPNLPEVHDFGSLADGTPYFTMELIAGLDLAAALPLPLHHFYDVFIQLARALSFIHARRLIHRDVKANNVRLVLEPDGSTRVVLMDLGLVSALGQDTNSTRGVSGTVAYLAPEALHGAVIDARSDLFSLGVLAAESLTGRLPRRFAQGAAPAAVAASGSHVDLSGLSNFPPGLVRLIRRLVADAPSRRPHSSDLVGEALAGQSGVSDLRSDQVQKRSYLATSSLVGRDAELARLRAALDAAVEGRGGALLISGSAGAGKSRLLQEFRVEAQLDGALWAGGGGREAAASPLQPVLEAMTSLLPVLARDAAGSLRQVAPVLLPLIPSLGQHVPGIDPAPALSDPAAELDRLLDAMISLLRATAGLQPLVLALDDLQWADGTTLRLLGRLLDTAGTNGRLMFLGSLRADEVEDVPTLAGLLEAHSGAVIGVGPFDSHMIRELLAEQFGITDVADDVVEGLLRRTGGNAFFLQEVLRYIVDQDLAAFTGGRWRMPETLDGVPLPERLSDILQRRLEARNAAEVAILEVFAAAGRPLDLWLLARVVGDDELFGHVDALRVHDLVAVEGDVISVQHDRIIEFTYERMSPARRRELHLRLAEVMTHARSTDPERYAFPDGEIGMQFLRGDDSEQAVDYLLEGGRRAFRVQALDEAIRLLEPAEETLIKLNQVGVGGRLDEVQDLLMRSVYGQSPTRALPLAARAIARYRSAGWMARIPALRRRLGLLGLILGLLATFLSIKRRRKGFDKSAFLGVFRRFLVTSTWRAQGLAWASRFDESLAVTGELEAYAPGRSLATLAACTAGSAALVHQGRFAEQAERLDEAYALAMGKAGAPLTPYDKRVLVRGAIGAARAMAGIWQGDPDALAQLDLDDGVTDDIEPIILEGLGAMVRIGYHAMRGEAREMYAEHRRYLDSRAIVRPEEREEGEHWMAWAAVEQGDFQRAREVADRFVHRGDLSEAWREIIRSRLLAAPLARIAAADQAIAAAERPGHASPLVATLGRLVLAEAHIEAGTPGRARTLLDEVLEFARSEAHRTPYFETIALRLLADAWLAEGDAIGAARLAADALELATALRNPVQRGLALRSAGAAETACGRHADAERHYAHASAEFEGLDNEYQLRLLRDLVGRSSLEGGAGLSTAMTVAVRAPFSVEGLDPATATVLVSSLDVERVAQALLRELELRLPEHEVGLYLPAAANRPPRTLGLDDGGELADLPDIFPLQVLELGHELIEATGGMTPLPGGGWSMPLRPLDDGDAEPRPAVGLLHIPAEPERLTEASIRELGSLLELGASALHNALRHESLLQREYRITLMHQLGQTLGAVRDHHELISLVLDRMIDLGQADRAFIMLRDEETGELEFKAGRTVDRERLSGSDFAVSRTAIGQAVESREIVHVSDQEALRSSDSVAALSLKSVTVVPLYSIVRTLAADPGGLEKAQQTLLAADPRELGALLADTRVEDAENIGVVYLESRRSHAGAAHEQSLLKLLAHQAGFAIDISRLQGRLVEEAAEQERLHQRQKQLARYLSADVAEAVMEQPGLMHLGGEHREVTVLFSDVRGFTRWASSRSPGEVVAALNRIFSVQTEVLFAHRGTLDKFLGDGLMALFGAPIASPDHARRAVEAAVDIQRRMATLLPDLGGDDGRGGELVGVGVGIHSGIAAVGNIGSDIRMEYTAIGDTVNIASRLCGLARAGQILMTRDMPGLADLPEGSWRPVGRFRIKGKDDEVELVEAETRGTGDGDA